MDGYVEPCVESYRKSARTVLIVQLQGQYLYSTVPYKMEREVCMHACVEPCVEACRNSARTVQ